jgi:hypothetical protein
MLPVGIRNASIINARKTKANIRAVSNHSSVFAISAALLFWPALLNLVFSVLLSDMNHYFPVSRFKCVLKNKL